MRKFIITLLPALLLIGCSSNSKDSKYIRETVGKPYEIFVVSTPTTYNSQVGDTLKSIFHSEVYMINFPEPRMKLLNMPTQSFKGINRQHRNIIMLQSGSKYPEPKVFKVTDMYATPQTVVVFEAPDTLALFDLVAQQGEQVLELFEGEELTRFATRAKKFRNKELNKKVDAMFDIDLSVPEGYKLRNTVGDDFMWISYELPEASQGIVIYEYPYTEGLELIDSVAVEARNSFVSRVPGELPNSYMSTSYEFYPESEVQKINGVDWLETRGFWRVENDFMGGPFVNYTTIDAQRNRVIGIDFYVYSPNPSKEQRTYIRQLEGLMRTVKINSLSSEQ